MKDTKIFKELSCDEWLSFIAWFEDYEIISGKKPFYKLIHPSIVRQLVSEWGLTVGDDGIERGKESKKEFKKRKRAIISERYREAIVKAVSPTNESEFLTAVRAIRCRSKRVTNVREYTTRFTSAISNVAIASVKPETIRGAFLAGFADPIFREEVEKRTLGMTPKEASDTANKYAVDVSAAFEITKVFEKRARTDKVPAHAQRPARQQGFKSRNDAARVHTGGNPKDGDGRARPDITCHKCGRKGHFADKCHTPKSLYIRKDQEVKDSGYLCVTTPDLYNFATNARVQGVGGIINVLTLLDTGATKNYISESTLKELGVEKKATKRLVRLANDATEECTGVVSLEIFLSKAKRSLGTDIKLTLEFLVLRKCPADMVIGAETLLDAGLIWTCIQVSDDGPAEEEADELFGMLEQEAEPVEKDVQEILDRFDSVFGPVDDCPAKLPMFRLDTEPGKVVSLRPYRRAREEEAAMENVLRENQKANVIEKTTAKWGSPALLVKKKSGKWRLVADYRQLNSITTPVDYPIPVIGDILNELGGSAHFTTLDLSSGYFQVPIHPDDRDKTTMVTPFGRYRYRRMPMGLRNAGAHFQWAMEEALAEFIHKGCVVYLDDIIIHAKERGDMLETLAKVLKKLQELGLKVGRNKCNFDKKEVEYLGWTISKDRKEITPERYEDLLKLVPPRTKKKAQSLLGFVNFLSEHIPALASTAKPIRQCCSTEPFKWNDAADKALEQLKHDTVKQLGRFDPNGSPLVLMTDASNVGLGGVILQDDIPIRYISHVFNQVESNWSTIEQECYALVYCMRASERLLRWKKFHVQTDHKNLTYAEKDHHSKVARWKMFMDKFHFSIEHVAGTANGGADGLSRLCSISDVDRADIIRSVHGACTGHVSANITVARLTNLGYKWNGMRNDVASYVKQCPVCAKERGGERLELGRNATPCGEYPLSHIAIDTMGPIRTGEKTIYLVAIIDTFSRFTEIYKCKTVRASEAAKALISWSGRYGCPEKITSDGGSQYRNTLWREIAKAARIDHHITTPYHPESNGRIERVNKDIGAHIRSIATYVGEGWANHLPAVQSIINNTQKEVLGGLTPSEVIFGRAQRPVAELLDGTGQNSDSISVSDAVRRIRTLCRMTVAIVRAREEERLMDTPGQDPRHPDFVLLEYPGGKPPSKATPRFRGPLRFIGPAGDETPSVTFMVEDLLTQKVLRVHGTRLRRWKGPTNVESLKEFAAWDCPDNFPVDQIVDHRKLGGKLEFLVRWLGYEPEEDTWEPAVSLGDAEALDKYLADKGLRLEDLE